MLLWCSLDTLCACSTHGLFFCTGLREAIKLREIVRRADKREKKWGSERRERNGRERREKGERGERGRPLCNYTGGIIPGGGGAEDVFARARFGGFRTVELCKKWEERAEPTWISTRTYRRLGKQIPAKYEALRIVTPPCLHRTSPSQKLSFFQFLCSER